MSMRDTFLRPGQCSLSISGRIILIQRNTRIRIRLTLIDISMSIYSMDSKVIGGLELDDEFAWDGALR